MRHSILVAAAIAVSLPAVPALAHHSFAMFDAQKTVTLDGTVSKFEWTNPHMWLYVKVPQASGDAIEYPLEMQGTAGAVRFGWKRDTVKTGDKVTVQIHPLRDGTHGGQLLNVVLADGKKMNVMGGGN